MKTTITLDDDVASRIGEQMRRSGRTFEDTVNDLLWTGLAAAHQGTRQPFRVTPRPLGLPAGLSYNCVAELSEAPDSQTSR